MRHIRTIAADIQSNWTKVSPYALPYLNAMYSLDTIEDSYGLDSAQEIVLRFLCNAQGFRGEHARRLKAELKELVG